jgi:hypothetical protein
MTALAGWIALTSLSCSRAPSADNQTPTVIHGEPIVAATPAPAPSQTGNATTATKTVPDSIKFASPAGDVSKSQPQKPSQSVPLLAATEDYSPLGFDKLASYNFEVDDAPFTNQLAATDKSNDQIPARVKAFNQKKVSIRGFMLPLKVSAGEVTEFLIMKDQSLCCYGSVPKITEWVSVKTTGHGVKPIMDQPVSMLGTLHVGAMRENGYLIGIYQMDGDKLILPDN